jgi:3'(2'), 5'-bisphosphate nucleotidase
MKSASETFAPQHRFDGSALIPVVLEAGRVQLRYHRCNVPVMSKSDETPVTCADQESEAVILAGLAKLAPDIPVVAEEEAAAGRLPEIGRTFFLVDPLDGTREFIAGRAEFTINIALVDTGVPVFGLVYAPVTGDLFMTSPDGRAMFVNVGQPDRLDAPVVTDMAPIHVRRPPADGLVAAVSFSHMNAETEAILAQFQIAARRQAGSSLKFCMVARGEADIYPRVGRTFEWDTAAGHAVLRAAGGTMTKLDGSPFMYGKAAEKFLNPDYIAWGGEPIALKSRPLTG